MQSLSNYRRLITWGLVAYTVALLLGTHLPKDAIPELHEKDKVIHFVAFLGLSLLTFAYQDAYDTERRKGMVAAFVALILFASADEYTQQFSPGRFSTLSDWVANCIGIAVGTFVWSLARSRFPSNTNRSEMG